MSSSSKKFAMMFLGVLAIASSGCLPETPPLEGPLTPKDAQSGIMGMHAAHGNIYTADCQWNKKRFKANWELANILKRRAQLQIKPPVAEFNEAELYMALATALDDEVHSPWHYLARDTILRCFRNALMDPDSDSASDVVAESPYGVNVKVKKNGSEWFVQVVIHNAMDPEKVVDVF